MGIGSCKPQMKNAYQMVPSAAVKGTREGHSHDADIRSMKYSWVRVRVHLERVDMESL